MKIIKTAINKKWTQNLYFFIDLHRCFKAINENAEAGEGLYQKLTPLIEEFEAKHYRDNFKYKYNTETLEKYSLKQLMERREETQYGNQTQTKPDTDESVLEVAREAERKLKRLKMAKYSTELFDEIVKEMMNEKKTIMEMMAELDVEDEAIFSAQTRLAKFIQAKNKVN